MHVFEFLCLFFFELSFMFLPLRFKQLPLPSVIPSDRPPPTTCAADRSACRRYSLPLPLSPLLLHEAPLFDRSACRFICRRLYSIDLPPPLFFRETSTVGKLASRAGYGYLSISLSLSTYVSVQLALLLCVIGQYAVPILDEKSVWGTDAPTRIAYIDTQDIARLTFVALRNEKLMGSFLHLLVLVHGQTQEVITLCERFAGQEENITTVPVSVLRVTTRQLTRLFEWRNDVADRLAFSEVLSSDIVFSVLMNETYSLLGVDAKDIVTLEKYLQDYFTNILKKLKDLKAQSKQSDIYF